MLFSSSFNKNLTTASRFCYLSDKHAEHSLRITEQLSAASKVVVELLPLLLSTNTPTLPGYVANYQLGKIANYRTNHQTLTLIKQLFAVSECSLLKTNSIDGIYTIGSVGSVGQSRQSDWDIWVCFPHKISTSEQQQFDQKCQAIESRSPA